MSIGLDGLFWRQEVGGSSPLILTNLDARSNPKRKYNRLLYESYLVQIQKAPKGVASSFPAQANLVKALR